MRRRGAALVNLIAVVSLAAVAVIARADDGGFWDKIKRPNHERYLALVTQGIQLESQQKHQDAADVLRQAAQIEPNEPEAWYWLGVAESKMSHWDLCIEAFRRADALVPGYDPVNQGKGDAPLDRQLGLCLAASGRYQEAIFHYERGLARDGLTTGYRANMTGNLADCYHGLGRLEEAVRTYQAAIDLEPRGSDAMVMRFALAVAFDRDEQWDRAYEAMVAALGADPRMSAFSRQYVFANPHDEDYYRGLAYEVAGQSPGVRAACEPVACRAMARAHFRRYLELAPKDDPWRERAAAHARLLGDAAPMPGSDEIELRGLDDKGQKPYRKQLDGVVPKLQQCLAAEPMAVVIVEITLPGKNVITPKPVTPKPKPQPKPKQPPDKNIKKKPPPPPPPPPPKPVQRSFVVRAVGPIVASEVTRKCVQELVQGISWAVPATTLTIKLSVAPVLPALP